MYFVKIDDTNKINFAKDLSFSLGVYIILFLLKNPLWETVDDLGIIFGYLGKVYYPEPTDYLIFSSSLYGRLLISLNTICPIIPWHSFILTISIIFSFASVVYLTREYYSSIFRFLFLTFFVIGFLSDIVWQYQFTKISFFSGFIGLFLLFHKRPLYLISFFLLSFSFLIRTSSFQLACILFAPYFLLFLCRNINKKQIIRISISIVFFLLVVMSSSIYNRLQGYKYFQDLNYKRAQLTEYGYLDQFTKHERVKILNSVGWSNLDFILLRSWFYLDENKFSSEKIDLVLSEISKTESPLTISEILVMNNAKVKKLLNKYFTKYTNLQMCSILLLLLISMLYSSKLLGLKYLIIVSFGIIIFFFVTVFYKPPPLHVINSFYLYFISIFIYFKPKSQIKQQYKIILISISLIVIGYFILATKDRLDLNEEALKELKYLEENYNEHLLLRWGVPSVFKNFSVFENYSEINFNNIFALGPSIHSPSKFKYYNRFDISNIELDLVKKDSVSFMVPNHRKKYLSYFVRKVNNDYNLEIEPKLIDDRDYYKIYNFSYKH